jgi:sigma-E factor negative regulatory protein RseB
MNVRYVALVTGAGALVGGLPCWASTTPGLADERAFVSTTSRQAQRLLETAEESSRTSTWQGVQHVVSVRDGHPTFTVLRLSHQPGAGSQVSVLSATDDDATDVTVDQPTDSRMLSLLGQHYDLALAGEAECTGRRAVVVEARRRGVTGPASVAGRFWVDSASHLVLRREVLDTAGSVIRSAAFVEMSTGPVLPAAQPVGQPVVRPTGELLSAAALTDLEAEGWPVPRTITSASFDLFEARLHEGGATPVLQLSYSDGLSTLSLFVQRGWLDGDPAGTARSLDGGTVWVEQGAPERVVWSGGEFTWTLVSDAASETVTEAVSALPHRLSVIDDDGVPERLWRGMARVGGWLNPFD